MFDLCNCPEESRFCVKYNIKISKREHQYLQGTSGLSREKEEFFIARLLGISLPEKEIVPTPKQIERPSLLQRGISAIKGGVEHLLIGLPTVHDNIYKERLSICNKCPQLDKDNICNVCGCFVTVKAKWSEQYCPLCKNCGRPEEEHITNECTFSSKWKAENQQPQTSGGCGGCGGSK